MNGNQPIAETPTAGDVDRWAASVHEAGHGVCAHALGLTVHEVVSDLGADACLMRYSREASHPAREIAAVCLAGLIASCRPGGWSREEALRRSASDIAAAATAVAATRWPAAELEVAFYLARDVVERYWSAVLFVGQCLRALTLLSDASFLGAMNMWKSTH